MQIKRYREEYMEEQRCFYLYQDTKVEIHRWDENVVNSYSEITYKEIDEALSKKIKNDSIHNKNISTP